MKSSKSNSWTKTNIGSVCRVGDGAHGSLKRHDQGILYLTSKNFKDDGLDLSKVDYIDEATYQKYFKEKSGALTKPIENDVLFSIIGSIGTPYIVKSSDRFGMSSSVAMLRPDTSVISPKYLFYWIKGHIFQDALYGIKGGVAQGYVSLEMIRSLPIHYPSISAQRRIANILSAYDDLIENNTRRIRILEQMAQAIYQEWFGKVDKESLPKGWKLVSLGGLIDFTKGKKPKETSSDGETPLLLIESIQKGITEFTNDPNVVIAQTDDVLMVMDGASSGKVFLGQSGAVGSTLGRYRPKDKETFSHYHFYLFILANLKQIADNNIGSAIPHANKDFINQLQVCLASLESEKKFHDQMKPIFDLVSILQKKNTNLRQTRDLLLPRLISGEIELQ